MSELTGHNAEGSDAPNAKGRGLDDWQRIHTEWDARAKTQRAWDAAHEPSAEFEKAARPLPPDYGRDRPATRTISLEQRAEMVEMWSEAQVAKLEASGRLVVDERTQPGQAAPGADQSDDRPDHPRTQEHQETTPRPRDHPVDAVIDQHPGRGEDGRLDRAEHLGNGASDPDVVDRPPHRRRSDRDEPSDAGNPTGKSADTTRSMELGEGTNPPSSDRRNGQRHQSDRAGQQLWVDGLLLIADPTKPGTDAADAGPDGNAADEGEPEFRRQELPAWALQDPEQSHAGSSVQTGREQTGRHHESDQTSGQPASQQREDRDTNEVHRGRESTTAPSPELGREALEAAVVQLAADTGRSVYVFNREGEHIDTEHRGPDAYAAAARHYLQETGQILSAARYEEDPFVKGSIKMIIDGDNARTMVGSQYVGQDHADPTIARAVAAVLPEGYSVTIQQSAYESAVVIDGRRPST